METIPVYTQSDGVAIKVNGQKYKKKSVTYLRRIEGPFTVYTNEGPLTCQDGYIAYDETSGHVWPVDVEYVRMNYEEVQLKSVS